ncbi:hypothetical protein, partial [Ruminococcus sp.]|uniref:hypothetical protein n=1 Tax=Ruminococcus sp. TaxID=41978 RepID=UPI003F04D318
EPTTVPEEPTTVPEEPTTAPVEPTTAPEEPTTAPEEPTTAPVEDAVYVVAGSGELCGTTWDPSPVTSPDNVMTPNGDGTYSLVFNDVAPMDSYQFKVVENIGETQNWYGVDGGDDNFTFNVTAECDVTVTFDPATKTITVAGEGVEIPTELIVESMRTVGNGDGNWLNGVAWDPADDQNLMEEISDKVYAITYEDIEEYDNYQVKFAANGSWAANWGGVFEGSEVESDAVFNSNDNITVVVPYELADVTLILDLTNFDYASKSGAKFTVIVTEKTTPSEGLNIIATSNYFPETNYTLTEDAGTDLVTVTYYFDCAKQLLNTQWTLIYDEEVLEVLPENNVGGFMPFATEGAMYDTPMLGVISGSASNLALYEIKDGQAFVQVTFRALTFEGETVVDLYVEDLTVSELDPATGKADETKDEALVVNGQFGETETPVNLDTEITLGTPEVPTEEPTEAPTEEPTEAPTEEPTEAPTEAPTEEPTEAPTEAPTEEPTEAPTEAPTEEPTVAPTTSEVAPATDATGATGTTVKPATSDTPQTPVTPSGAVQTGNASMAVIILLVLVSACGILYFTRKRVK